MPFVTEGVHRGQSKSFAWLFRSSQNAQLEQMTAYTVRACLPALALDWFNSRLRRTLPSESIGSTLADIRH
jgi:hypothetical protein